MKKKKKRIVRFPTDTLSKRVYGKRYLYLNESQRRRIDSLFYHQTFAKRYPSGEDAKIYKKMLATALKNKKKRR